MYCLTIYSLIIYTAMLNSWLINFWLIISLFNSDGLYSEAGEVLLSSNCGIFVVIHITLSVFYFTARESV